MKEPNLFIEAQDYGYNNFNWIELKSLKLPLGSLSSKEVKKFVQELKRKAVNLSECLPRIHINLITNTKMYLNEQKWDSDNTYKLKISLFPKVLEAKCGAKRPTDCLNNIYNGKCVCPEVNKLFFERFFVENQIRGKAK